jgi:RNA polymerase sigma factor (TIGR02999 family)
MVDEARQRGYLKQGGAFTRVALAEDIAMAPERNVDLMALDEALGRLEQRAPRKCRVIELRFFGGLSIEETATVLGVHADTVKREWRTAKLWLWRELSGAKEASDGTDTLESD